MPEPKHTHDPDMWGAALVICDLCGKKWAAVYPMCCDTLECPGCGHMTRAPHLCDEPVEEPREPWRGTEH